VVMRTPPRIEDAAELPWWAWVGGFCGVLALAGMTAAAPRLGAATMIAAVVCAQVVVSILLDRFGLFGIPPTVLTPQRMLAAALLLSGAVLIR
jgi:bacterial/archaeal transporter family-2 protein